MRVWEVEMPCGITFLGLSFVEVNPSVWVAIVLPARQLFVHRCMVLFMLASLIFVKRPRIQTRIFSRSPKTAIVSLFV